MGKIASWNDIYQKFNVGERSNRCPTKKEILAYTSNFIIAGNYQDSQCVQLSDISYKATISIVWFDFPSVTPTTNGLLLSGGQIEDSEGSDLDADVYVGIQFSADVYGQDTLDIKIPKGSRYYEFNDRIFVGIDMSQSKSGYIGMMSGSSTKYNVETDLTDYKLTY